MIRSECLRTIDILVTPSMLDISSPRETADIASIREMLIEYRDSLGVDLCFQGFDAELRDLPGDYAPPHGRLLIARQDDMPIGCVALRDLGNSRGEMKRLYVRPAARGLGVGRALVTKVLEEARAIGYRRVVLDTLPTMIEAQALYEHFGFREIAAYYTNPIPGSRYLEKEFDAG